MTRRVESFIVESQKDEIWLLGVPPPLTATFLRSFMSPSVAKKQFIEPIKVFVVCDLLDDHLVSRNLSLLSETQVFALIRVGTDIMGGTRYL